MGRDLQLTASDGHVLGAFRADPKGAPGGGIVVLQEIFGVNAHIRDVTESFAGEGYAALAPALYDRSSRRGVELGYSPDDLELGRRLREEFSWDLTVRDVEAAVTLLRGEGLKVATIGYCWGGSISFLAAVRLPLDAAVVYYGGQIMAYLREPERCPLLLHFGRRDVGIPLGDVEAIARAHPRAALHLYDAGHGFNCDRRESYDASAAGLARDRTLAFLATHLA
jgi:carboxymethylenebutenolidase